MLKLPDHPSGSPEQVPRKNAVLHTLAIIRSPSYESQTLPTSPTQLSQSTLSSCSQRMMTAYARVHRESKEKAEAGPGLEVAGEREKGIVGLV
jgi:hypothetical protein